VAFDFTEEDFAPKSQHDFSEEDFQSPVPPITRNALGESKEDLLAKAATLRTEGAAGNIADKLINAGMWGTYLTPLRGTAARLLNIPGNEPYELKPIVSPESIKQEIDPITQSMGLTDPVTQGATEFTAETGSGLTTPDALEAAALGAPGARLFQAQMIKDSPQALENLRQASKTGDIKETTKAALGAGLSIAGPLAIERGLQPAAEAAQPKEENASTVRTDTGQPTETGKADEGSEANRGGDIQQAASGAPNAPTQGQAPREVPLTPSVESVVSMSGPDFAKFSAREGNRGLTEKAYEIANSLRDPEAFDKAKEQVTAQAQEAKSKIASAAPEEKMKLLEQGLAISMKRQYFDEAAKMSRALKEVEGGKDVAEVAKRIGVKENDLRQFSETKPEPAETVLASQSTGHGLPVGVPDRGPAFAADLMEASRQLGALVRSRATLRPGVLGQFVKSRLAGIKQQDRIEVGDIRNQNTVAHEIGHSLDGILFPAQNFGNSQASLAARVGTGTGKELAGELTKVSELMRGPMTGSAGHIQYRKRAAELIADYFSLYAHDRDRAAAMAPKFTKGFEATLAKDQNTADVVKGVVSGNVIPRPPDPTLKKQLAGITGTPPQPGTPVPGAVPAPPQLPPPARERVAAVAAEGLVKDAVRTFESKVQSARIVGDTWRKSVPNQVDRNDVGAFVEGIGNLEKPGDTIDRVRTRMTPAKERLAKDYRFRQELERQEINKYLKDTEEGEYLSFLEDYLGHFYVDNTAKRQAAVSRWAKESPHAKQRKLPTLKEAVDLGLTPITQDPAVTYELNSRINWQVATNRKFVGELKDVFTGGGQPVVVPAKDAPAGWPVTNNPLIQRVYARQTPSGLMLWRGGAAIHPDIWRSARQILEAPMAGDLGKAYDAINGFTRANAFAFSLFHDLTLRSAAVGSQASLTNPLRGLVRVFERHPITGERTLIQSTRELGKELLQNEEAVSDAAEHGLKFAYTDSEAYQHAARTALERAAAKWRQVPVLGKATRLARDVQQWRQEGLWKNTHDAFKVITYHDLVSKALEQSIPIDTSFQPVTSRPSPSAPDVKAIKEQIASYLNDAYGGQEWQTKFWLDPGTRKVLSRFFLAPDWTLSTLRSVPGLSDVASAAREQAPRLAGRESFPTPKEGLEGAGRRLRFWGAEVAALAMATAAAQYVIYKSFGDDKKGDKPFPWDNELNQKMRVDVTPVLRKFPWTDKKDPTRHYVNLGKRPQEILNWFTSPDQQILSKSSRPVAMIFEQFAGTEGDFKAPWKQDHESFIESLPKRSVEIGKQALPFTLLGNQFVLSVPMRKGMTKYKAQQAYESVFELATQPNKLRSMLRGQGESTGTIAHMSEQITDAARRNGVPAEDVMRHALSVVRGHHYNEFFKAFGADDQKKMDEEARALIVLGATTENIKTSVKKRVELEPTMPQEATQP
jgi:hypothetical protein